MSFEEIDLSLTKEKYLNMQAKRREVTTTTTVDEPKPILSRERLPLHTGKIAAHFESLAKDYYRLKKQNKYYNEYLVKWCKSLLPAGKKVLDIGSGRGDVLNAVEPGEGVGIDVSPTMVALASEEFPHLQFKEQKIEDFKGDGSFDAVTMINTLEYLYDIGEVLDKIHAALKDNGRVYITTANPIWSPVFRQASKMGLRIPECDRLYVTNEDLVNMLQLHGYEVVYKKMALILPKYIPLLSSFLNFVFPYIPFLHLLCSTQLIAARKVPQKPNDYSVSVVIPCHNEVGNVDRCVTEMRKFGSRTELIFVDDGSKDGTAEAVKPELNPDIDVKVISYFPNQGKGSAVKKGFDEATGDIVMILDADLTTHPEELEPIYEALSSGRAEFINCTRFVYPMEGGAMPYFNYIGNKCFSILASLIMEQRVSDTLCGTKAMFREDYENMVMGRDPWGDYDFLFGAAQLRLSIKELPIHYRERLAGLSKMNTKKHTINLLKMCVQGFKQVKLMHSVKPQNKIKVGSDSRVG
jgi:ubiquinone/menaquinone biosynthesis C-methylase UbiE